jgi:transposase
MWYVGLDVHLKQSTFCVLDDNGKQLQKRTVHGSWNTVLEELKAFKEPFAICFEACTGYGYLFEELNRIARRVVVAHPGQLRLIFRSKRKNDRVDSEKLAKLLYLDEVPPVYVPSIQVRSWRSIIEHRHKLVREQTRIKNAIRALLRTHGTTSPKRLWSKAGRRWLSTVELPTELYAVQLDILRERLESIICMIKRVEKLLGIYSKRHPGVALLMTIPGVGPRTAEAVTAYIDRANRFHRSKAIGRYFGIVPSQDASAGKNRLGHITRESPGTVRNLVAEATWQGIRRSPRIHAYFERILRGNPKRKKIALIATAHYLLRVMHAMLRTGEMWRQGTA